LSRVRQSLAASVHLRIRRFELVDQIRPKLADEIAQLVGHFDHVIVDDDLAYLSQQLRIRVRDVDSSRQKLAPLWHPSGTLRPSEPNVWTMGAVPMSDS
jgi:hypothetical protein